jgi:DNA-binding response OmpR family regulator
MKKIVVIDDEKDFNFFLKKNLEQQGDFEVITCSDSTKAVELVKTTKPNLILLDILMPNVSGIQIAEEIRDDKDIKDIPIIFITAAVTRKETDKEGNIIGGRYFIAKPARVSEIINMIKKLSI